VVFTISLILLFLNFAVIPVGIVGFRYFLKKVPRTDEGMNKREKIYWFVFLFIVLTVLLFPSTLMSIAPHASGSSLEKAAVVLVRSYSYITLILLWICRAIANAK
jgi:hypothetical protein